MPQKRLHGWTPGSPIDGQRMRVYRNSALAGTYVLENSDTEVIIDVVANSVYSCELRSFRETQESMTGLTCTFNTYMMMPLVAPSSEIPESAMVMGYEHVPPPTGTISVSDA